MKRRFKVEKIPLETLISLLMDLYEKGIDYVDLYANNDDPGQDRLIILTKDDYINPSFFIDGKKPEIFDNSKDVPGFKRPDSQDDDEDDPILHPKNPPIIEIEKLSDEDLEELT